jgi:hypothetical protein
MRTVAIALMASLIMLSSGNTFAQDTDDWRKVAGAIPLGSRVRIQRVDGSRVSGTLMRVDDARLTLKKNTRLPEAPMAVTFDQIANIEREHGGGMSWGKAIGIGLGAGAGAILTIFVIALQLD